ncbi:DUF7696 family protein [Achromobacter mucicolens]|uniref:DUF7696 family protein n=1 Tax=Achromobacter mucicolens TaxID=1389922 RepID=UPI003B96C63F
MIPRDEVGEGSEARRRECEARHVLTLPFDRRKPYLDLVAKRRGVGARHDLELEVKRQFALRRKAA